MNLLLAGVGRATLDLAAVRRALASLLEDLPFFDAATRREWTASSERVALLTVGPPAEAVGGVSYVASEPGRAAAFAGRPVLWSAGGRADGKAALDARTYLEDAEAWAVRLEGRCAVVRAGEGGLQLATDPMGAYPLFTCAAAGGRWYANNPELLRRITGTSEIDELALAGLLGGGWSLGGHPIWRAVRRVPRGTLVRAGVDGVEATAELLPAGRVAAMAGGELDVAAAAAGIVELVGALSRWPGRPDVVPVTGGRDSRVILAAALQAGIPFAARTGGGPQDPDVTIAQRLCARAGLPHDRLGADPHGDRFSALRRAAEITMLTAGGTASLQDAAGYPLGPRPGPLPLWHSGQGGEIARSYFGPGDGGSAGHLFTKFVGRRPGRTEIVSGEAGEMLRARITGFVAAMREAGAAEGDVPDLFYVFERMACWAAPSHTMVELIRDTTSPLWSARLLPALLALPPQQRSVEVFHYRMVEALAPHLLDEPFQDGSTWSILKSPVARRAERAWRYGRKIRAEVRRRATVLAARPARPTRGTGGSRAGAGEPAAAAAPGDPFDAIMADVREAALNQPAHPAWAALDRPRVEGLLASPAVGLDEMNRMFVWRLATVFLGLPQPG